MFAAMAGGGEGVSNEHVTRLCKSGDVPRTIGGKELGDITRASSYVPKIAGCISRDCTC